MAQVRTYDGCVKAVEMLGKAVQIDHRFAQAYAALGSAHANAAAFVFEPTAPRMDEVKH